MFIGGMLELLLDEGFDGVELPPQAANVNAKSRLPRNAYKNRLFIFSSSIIYLLLAKSMTLSEIPVLPIRGVTGGEAMQSLKHGSRCLQALHVYQIIGGP